MRVIAALIAAVLACTMVAASAEAKRVLRLTIQLPLKSVLGKNIAGFKADVEAATSGSIEVQIFDSGQLFEDKDVPKAVGSGQIEMAVVSLARYAPVVAAVEVFYIPFLFDTEAKLRAAVAPTSPVRGPLDEAIGATGARVLWWQAYGGTVLLSKGGQPVRSPDDLKGRRIRIVSSLLGKWVEAGGGVPVDIVGGDQYFAYQGGTVDIGMTAPATIKTRKLWEVMDTITLASVGASEFVVVINAAAFDALPEAEQAIILTAARTAETKLRNDVAQIEKEAIEAGRQHNMTVYLPDAREMAAFRESANVVRDAFLTSAGDLGRRVHDAALELK